MNAPWTLYTPMRMEAAALRRGLAEVSPDERGTVRRIGIGPRHACGAADLTPASAVAVAGTGGGLSATLRPGDVVVASQVLVDPHAARAVPATRTMPAAELLATALRDRGMTVHLGPVVSTRRLVDGATRERLAATGALVADLESAWLLAGCENRPLACVRVVADTLPGRLYRPATLAHLHTAARVTRRRCRVG